MNDLDAQYPRSTEPRPAMPMYAGIIAVSIVVLAVGIALAILIVALAIRVAT